MTGTEGAAAELHRRAALEPEDPFLFFRDRHGHFRWWSWGRAARAFERAAGGVADAVEPPGAETAVEFLAALAGADEGERAGARVLLDRLGRGPEREVWISFRPFDRLERTVATAALLGGWAVLREPADPLPPATFAWARPTVLIAPAASVERLLAGTAAEAPRACRARWLRRRLARLRAVVVEEGVAMAPLAERLRALGATAEVLSLDAGA